MWAPADPCHPSVDKARTENGWVDGWIVDDPKRNCRRQSLTPEQATVAGKITY